MDAFVVARDHKETILILESIVSKFREKHKRILQTEYLPIKAFVLLLLSEIRALEYLNCDPFLWPVYWDMRYALPSLVSMRADTKIYAESLEKKSYLRRIVRSFGAWEPLLSETHRGCVCGNKNGDFKGRDVALEIKVRHEVSGNEKNILIKQCVGVESADKKHMYHHYCFDTKRESYDGGGPCVVWESKNLFSLVDGCPQCSEVFTVAAHEFNRWAFASLLDTALKEAECLYKTLTPKTKEDYDYGR